MMHPTRPPPRQPPTNWQKTSQVYMSPAPKQPHLIQGKVVQFSSIEALVTIALSQIENNLKVPLSQIKREAGGPVEDSKELLDGLINVYKHLDGATDYILLDPQRTNPQLKFTEQQAVIENFKAPNFILWFWESDERKSVHFQAVDLVKKAPDLSLVYFINSVVIARFIEGAHSPISASILEFRPLLEEVKRQIPVTQPKPNPSLLESHAGPHLSHSLDLPKYQLINPNLPKSDQMKLNEAIDELVDYATKLAVKHPKSGDPQSLKKLSVMFESYNQILALKLGNCSQLLTEWRLLNDKYELLTKKYDAKENTAQFESLGNRVETFNFQTNTTQFQLPNDKPEIQTATPAQIKPYNITIQRHNTYRPLPSRTIVPSELSRSELHSQTSIRNLSSTTRISNTLPEKSDISQRPREVDVKLNLTLSNGQIYPVDNRIKKLSEYLNSFGPDQTEIVIPPTVSEASFAKVIEFVNHRVKVFEGHQDSKVRVSTFDSVLLGPRDKEFINKFAGKPLTGIAQASCVLKISSLFNLCIDKIYRTYNQTDLVKISQFLGVPCSDEFVIKVYNQFIGGLNLKP